MAPSFFISLLLLLLMSFFHFSSTQPLCREFERLALEQFKNSFLIVRNASTDPLAYSKVDLWKSQGSDCCSWEGITCSQHTGHVIGIELNSSCLFGSINSSSTLFRLAHLRYLNLSDNNFNYSSIPSEFGNLSRLISLDLSNSVFSGQVPFEISKLSKLTKLDLSWNVDSSTNQGLLQIKPPLWKSLIQNLTRLDFLHLSSVSVNSSIPHALANLSSLTYLGLSQCGLFGEFPNAIFQLPKLESLSVSENSGLTGILPKFHFSNPLKELDVANTSFSGEIPKSLGLLNSLDYLVVRNCDFSGILPSLPSNLTKPYFFSLRVLDISFNQISGEIPPDFCNMTSLQYLDLSYNNLGGIIPQCLGNRSSNSLTNLLLGTNNLRGKLPRSLANYKNLKVLGASDNQISGEIPPDFCNMTSLQYLDLSLNDLGGIIPQCLGNHSSNSLTNLHLGQNNLQGKLPRALANCKNLKVLDASINQITGEVPPDFCNMTSLQYLDLSLNNLSGIIPQCLGNRDSSYLTNLVLGHNNLQGKLPRSLANCKNLEYLDVNDNQIRDTFPSWLGLLPHLKIIILRSNRFYGSIDDSESGSLFPELRIGDLAHNEFMGRLPLNYFRKWNIMAFLDKDAGTSMPFNVTYSKTLKLFSAIDLSNKFSGEIPEIVDNLRRLELLNLSNNNLIGPVPPELGYLSKLEALDLSNNKLTGTIPPELTQLEFLEVFDVSNNLLTGPIPRGSQFDTFENSSFQGNPGLCGMPLSKKCGNHLPLPLWKATVDEENKHITSLLSEIGWKAVLIGFGCGVLGGAVLGVKVFARQQKWLMETFRIKQGRRKSGNRRR